MVLMIDYDNLGRLKRRSLSQIIQILTEKIPESNVTSLKNGMKCRLYGGWLYRGNQRTRMARDLLRQIHGEFPLRIRVHDHQGLMKKPELATSLICDSMSDFPDTFRIRSQPPRLNVRRFPLQGCKQPISCPISAVNSFWYHKTCVHENCRVSPDDAFIRPEQKLVDSMYPSENPIYSGSVCACKQRRKGGLGLVCRIHTIRNQNSSTNVNWR